MSKPDTTPDVALSWRTSEDVPLEALPDLYRAGASLATLAARTGHDINRIYDVLRQYGVEMRPRNQLGSKNRNSHWHAQAIALRAAGVPFAAIAERFGRTPAAVHRVLRLARLAAAAPPAPPPGPIDPPLGYPVEAMDDYGPGYGG